MVRRITILFAVLQFLLVCCPQPLAAVEYDLPPTQFQTYTERDSSGNLPRYGGLHLTEGEDRPPDAPPEVYNPGEPALDMALCRWPQNKMPLLIWISPGLKLPDGPLDELKNSRVMMVYRMLQSDEPFYGLEKSARWTEEHNYVVAAGFESWRDMENEGVIRYGFVDDPRQAHILVFFSDGFHYGDAPGGCHTDGLTCSQMFTPQQLSLPNYKQLPVVLELVVREDEEKMRGNAAHEFGHAIGIKAHSPFRQDLMHENRVVPSPSPSDKATLRYLYSHEPQFFF